MVSVEQKMVRGEKEMVGAEQKKVRGKKIKVGLNRNCDG